MSGPYQPARGGVAVTLRVTPRAGRDHILGVAEGVLRVAVGAPAHDGKANEAVINYLAECWRLPRARLRLMHGRTSRNKRIMVTGETDTLMAHLGDWSESLAAKQR